MLEHTVPRSNFRKALNDRVRTDLATGSNLNLVLNDGIGTDTNIICQSGPRADHTCGMRIHDFQLEKSVALRGG